MVTGRRLGGLVSVFVGLGAGWLAVGLGCEVGEVVVVVTVGVGVVGVGLWLIVGLADGCVVRVTVVAFPPPPWPAPPPRSAAPVPGGRRAP